MDPGIHLGQADLGSRVRQLELCLACRGMTFIRSQYSVFHLVQSVDQAANVVSVDFPEAGNLSRMIFKTTEILKLTFIGESGM